MREQEPGPPPAGAPLSPPSEARTRGFAYGLGAYGLWGLMPVYFKALAEVPALELLAHRVLWAFAFLLPVAFHQDRLAGLRAVLRSRRSVALLLGTTTFIALNWLIYIWAVLHGRVVEASLGYFMTPLVNVLLGVVVLRERLERPVVAALLLAAAGVLWLALLGGRPPWVSLGLALSFGTYGLLRKLVAVGALAGLVVETAFLLPFCLIVLAYAAREGTLAFRGGSGARDLLLLSAGPITAVPLLFFAGAVRRLPLSSLGFLQYLSPSVQLLLAVFVYGEPFGFTRGMAFGLIWCGLLIFGAHTLRVARRYRGARPGG